MMQLLAIGLSAGAASALLFASIASGSAFSIILFYLAPLPIMIAALGWSHWAGLLAAVAAALGLSAFLGGFFIIVFLVSVGLPAWWLGYLALLARPGPDDPQTVEWYPVGRLVVWGAIVAALTVVAALPNFGLDEESMRATLRASFARVLKPQIQDAPEDLRDNFDRMLDLLVAVTPLMAAVVPTLTNSLNLWLAGRIVNVSGYLRRPWPDISAMRFPPFAPALLAAAMAASFLPDLLGIVGSVLAASLLTAYAILGFAVLHMLTRQTGARVLILAGAYAVMPFVWPMLLMALLGLTDAVFDIRGRFASRQGGPLIRND